MNRMAPSLLALALLVPAVSAAPAPNRAKEKLDTMKKKLPEAVQKWHQAYWGSKVEVSGPAEVRVVRQVSPTEAKVTILVHGRWLDGTPYPAKDEAVTIYLRFYEGNWTSTRSEVGSRAKAMESVVQLLMLAIDELGEK